MFLFLALPASAQTNTDLLTDLWLAGQRGQVRADVWGLSSQVSEPAPNDDASYSVYRSRTRLRLGPSADPAPVEAPRPMAFGHEYTHVDFASADPRVPARLVRQEMALGIPLGEAELFGDTWRPGAVVGFGHSSTNAYHDGEAWYAVATVFAQRTLDSGATLLLGVTYDGNRSTFPDVPLPIFEYRKRLNVNPITGEPSDAELGLRIGYPESRITYRPDRQWTFSAGFDTLDWATAEARYQINDTVAIHAGYAGFYDMFHDADDQDNRRLFFISQRVEAGATLTPQPGLDVTLSGGYAFGQSLRRGFDWRATDEVVSFEDAPFVRLALGWRF